jgi:hypothetical protein
MRGRAALKKERERQGRATALTGYEENIDERI